MKTINIFILLAILIAISGMSSCRKDEPCENKIDLIPQHIQDYFLYPQDKYWILKNDQNEFDTITVRHSYISSLVTPYPHSSSGRDRTSKCRLTRDEISTILDVNLHENGLYGYIGFSLNGINSINIWARLLDTLENFDTYREHRLLYNQTDNAWTIQPGNVEQLDSITLSGALYTSNLQLHQINEYYDSLCLSPTIGIIRYYRNNKMYVLHETN